MNDQPKPGTTCKCGRPIAHADGFGYDRDTGKPLCAVCKIKQEQTP